MFKAKNNNFNNFNYRIIRKLAKSKYFGLLKPKIIK